MCHRIERIVRKASVIHPIDHRMCPQEFRNLTCVFYVAFHTERERLNSLQEQKSVKRRKRGTSVSLTDGSATRDKSGIPVMVNVDDAVISDLRAIQHVELVWILAPGKFTAVHNHPTDA